MVQKDTQKQVVLVTGAYFKIETIYRSSILGNFENVRLVKDDQELAAIVTSASAA